MLWHWYSNLAYSFTTIDSARFPIILWYFDTTLNPLLYYNWYSNLNDMILLIQQSSCYDTWYNNQYTYTPLDTAISMLWYLIQQPSLLLYNNWFSKLPYDLMILLIQILIHYYATMDTATLMLWYSDTTTNYTTIHDWYNNIYVMTLDIITNIFIHHLIPQSLCWHW